MEKVIAMLNYGVSFLRSIEWYCETSVYQTWQKGVPNVFFKGENQEGHCHRGCLVLWVF